MTLTVIFLLAFHCPVIRHACMHMCTKTRVRTLPHTHISSQTYTHSLIAYAAISCYQQSGFSQEHSIFLPLAPSSDSLSSFFLPFSLPPSEFLSLSPSISLLSPPIHLPTYWLLSLSSPAVSFCHSLFSLPLFASFLLFFFFYLHARVQMRARELFSLFP